MNRAQRILLAIAEAIVTSVLALGSFCLEVLTLPFVALARYATYHPAAGPPLDDDPIPDPYGDPDHI